MAATAEVLPAGNEWEFSERNADLGFTNLQPGLGRTEILQPTGRLGQIVQEVHSRFIQRAWRFTSLVTDSRFEETDGIASLAIVFTRPLKTALVPVERIMDLDFIRADVVVGVGTISPSDPINQILRGTGWVVDNTHAAYNQVSVGERLLEQTFKQTGVGVFVIDLGILERRIFYYDAQIKELMGKLSPLQQTREAFVALRSPIPIALFQTK